MRIQQLARGIVTSATTLAALLMLQAASAIGQGLARDLSPQPLAEALEVFAEQTGLQLVYRAEIASGVQSKGARGGLSAEETLRELLRETGLTFEFVNERTIAIRIAAGDARRGDADDARGQDRIVASAMTTALRLAQTDPGATGTSEQQGEDGKAERADEKRQTALTELGELVVTGTQIRGAKNIASPISVHTRDEIDRTGAGSVQRFIQTLPENFQGGAWEGTVVNTSGGRAGNAVFGTAVNLRGMGHDSTLVLLNGRRLAPGNSGNFVDVSMIPVAAIERVEVVPDGASALYGSDAVGGVVNFIMRKDFEGAETRARYGAVTEGNLREYQLSQTAGLAWDGGSALLSYEYFDQSRLDVNDKKSWVRNPNPGPFDVLPEQKRHGVFVSLEQAVGDGLELFADGMYGKRSADFRVVTPFFREHREPEIDAYSVTLGGRARLSNDIHLELVSSYGESDTKNTLTTARGTFTGQTKTSVLALDARLTGSLFALPAGPVLYAAGLHYREEGINFFEDDREVQAGFAELRVPLLGPDAERQGEPELELTLAGRYESYNDFGSTANPKVGLIWQPSSDLRLRGTWGTSFKAPLRSDMDPVPFQVSANQIFDPLVGGNVVSIFVFGGNPDLVPEEAKTWTLGADWTPESVPRLRARATYYDIAFTDRITNFQQSGLGISLFDVLRFEDLAAPFIRRNPTLAEVQAIIDSAAVFDDFAGPDFTPTPGGFDPAAVVVILDSRRLNLAKVDTSGIDFGLSYTWDFESATMETGIDGTHILKLDNQVVPTAPALEVVDTIFNPADLKLRGRAIVQEGGFSAALFVNYVDSYTDNRGGASIPVASWTTVDANIGYRFGDDDGPWSGVSVNVGATNLTDQAPPFIESPFAPAFPAVIFDGANADVRGRFVYAQVAKRF